MCGIVAVVQGSQDQPLPDLDALIASLEHPGDVFNPVSLEVVEQLASELEHVSRVLRITDGVAALATNPVACAQLSARLDAYAAIFRRVESDLDTAIAPDELEQTYRSLTAGKDALWAIQHDRIMAAHAVIDLAGGTLPLPSALHAYHAIQITLAALDRLEVRGRDSAGLHVLITGHALDMQDPGLRDLLASRTADPLFRSGSVRVPDGHLSFVYKTAAEIGELGDNTAQIRTQITNDALLRAALAADTAQVMVLAHTRWASVGNVSEENAHPLNHEELDTCARPFVVAALNGDVDNHNELKRQAGLRVADAITTDAKVIPALLSRALDDGRCSVDGFRSTVASFEGSVAIAAQTATHPGQLLLAQRGSGQALYVGLAPGIFMVASEPYGVVAECDSYLRLDGESMLDQRNPASQGQVVRLDRDHAGQLAGLFRCSYDGRALPVSESELGSFEITTRDVDRGDAPHYLFKEMTESPESFRKTLLGKIVDTAGLLDVHLPTESLTPSILDLLHSGRLRRILVIGQGTAAVAGQSLAYLLKGALAGQSRAGQTRTGQTIAIEAVVASELSGFGLLSDMSDTLVIAISQSGTTTDTNRTVDVVRGRGAQVLAIVNRRQSDLAVKADGVLYTSNGRDVEMSVASTKAFYSQVAAGMLLALALNKELDLSPEAPSYRNERLVALRQLPAAMTTVLGSRAAIAQVARKNVLGRRSWAIVGNGANHVAAHEIRIKLSELCYKSIACDVTEDKKHIDLSSEPMILVCASGLRGSNADDVAKELAIYSAHKAAPVAITDDPTRFAAVADTIVVPSIHPDLAFVLCAVAGHLFGYEAALAIDETAQPLRKIRELVSHAQTDQHHIDPLALLRTALAPHASAFFAHLRAGDYNSCLEAGTATQLTSVLRYATGVASLDTYQMEFGKVGTPNVVLADLESAVSLAIDELTRPIDAIKHQAKTVTVGTSRSDETLLSSPLVQEVLTAGASRDSLTYKELRTLVALDPAVAAVTGWTRYHVDGDTIQVLDRSGVAAGIPSRTETYPVLRGTKHRAATEREITVAVGADGRTLVLVPEVSGTKTTGLTLLHVQFHDCLPADAARRVLEGYRSRYNAIADQVTEVDVTMDDAVLANIPLIDLLTEPVVHLAAHWNSTHPATQRTHVTA